MKSQFKQSISYIQFELWLDCFIYNNRYILWLRRNYKKYTNFILLLTSPYICLIGCYAKYMLVLLGIIVFINY